MEVFAIIIELTIVEIDNEWKNMTKQYLQQKQSLKASQSECFHRLTSSLFHPNHKDDLNNLLQSVESLKSKIYKLVQDYEVKTEEKLRSICQCYFQKFLFLMILSVQALNNVNEAEFPFAHPTSLPNIDLRKFPVKLLHTTGIYTINQI
jgi:GTP-binding protein EngB required for normal cell division